MDLLSVIPVAFGLSADCFAVALSAGISKSRLSFLQQLRISLAFGLFQAVMTLVGWFLGRTVVNLISEYDHWLAFGFLALVGGKMIWESLHHNEDDHKEFNISKILPLLVLSIATSIDALAVGLSFAFVDMSIAFAAATIGIIALLITMIGLIIGRQVSKVAGSWAEIIGGLILIAIGCKILLEHILE